MSTMRFKSATYEGCELTINQTPSGAYLRTKIDGIGVSKFVTSTADAPAIALAILEAAGLVRDACSGDDAEVALEWLYSAVARREREAKEAADRSEAEGLGRKLYNADRSACDLIWEDLAPASKRRWVDRMARAREIIGATK